MREGMNKNAAAAHSLTRSLSDELSEIFEEMLIKGRNVNAYVVCVYWSGAPETNHINLLLR